MSAPKSNVDDESNYLFSLEIKTPNALNIAKGILDHIDSSNEGINRVNLEIESQEPFEPDAFIQPQEPNSDENVSEYQSVNAELDSEKTAQDKFSPESNKFKIASVLANEDTPMIVDEVLECIESTKWEISRKRISTILRNLSEDNNAIRNKRKTGSRGSYPYQYALTETSKEKILEIEENIRDDNGETYKVIKSKENDTVVKEHECERCGEMFETASGLGSHTYFKHPESREDDVEDTTDEETKVEEETDTEQTEIETDIDEEVDVDSEIESTREEEQNFEDINISPDTNRFHALSMIYNSAKPVTPKDIESRFEDVWDTENDEYNSDT